MLDRQDFINKCAARLLDGKGQALGDNYVCSYLTPDGNKCLVGLLIPDGHPAQVEVGGVGMICNKFQDLKKAFEGHRSFLKDIQALHDETDNWEGLIFNAEGKYQFRTLCVEYGLQIPEQFQ